MGQMPTPLNPSGGHPVRVITLKVRTWIADSSLVAPPSGRTLHHVRTGSTLQSPKEAKVSVLVDPPASLLAYRPAKLTAMVVVHDPRVRTSVTRHLWALGVRDVVEASTIAEARSRMATVRDIAVVDVHLPDGPGLALLAEMRTAG